MVNKRYLQCLVEQLFYHLWFFPVVFLCMWTAVSYPAGFAEPRDEGWA
jgi:hypothetical protein